MNIVTKYLMSVYPDARRPVKPIRIYSEEGLLVAEGIGLRIEAINGYETIGQIFNVFEHDPIDTNKSFFIRVVPTTGGQVFGFDDTKLNKAGDDSYGFKAITPRKEMEPLF